MFGKMENAKEEKAQRRVKITIKILYRNLFAPYFPLRFPLLSISEPPSSNKHFPV